jgi:hypothetical protein
MSRTMRFLLTLPKSVVAREGRCVVKKPKPTDKEAIYDGRP